MDIVLQIQTDSLNSFLLFVWESDYLGQALHRDAPLGQTLNRLAPLGQTVDKLVFPLTSAEGVATSLVHLLLKSQLKS